MVPCENRRRFIVSVLLLAIIPVAFATAQNALSDGAPTTAEILERLRLAQQQVSYAGKQISITWGPNGCMAHEALIVHQPPSTHLVKPLTLIGGEDGSRRFSEFRRRREEQRGRGRRERFNGQMGSRFDRRFFFAQPYHRWIESMAQKGVELLTQNYTVAYDASEQIAGHDTDLLTIESRFDGRPAKRIWIATDKGVVLRLEELDARGRLQSLSVYTQIDFRPETVAAKLAELQSTAQAQRRKPPPTEDVNLSEAQEAFDHQLRLPAYLPQGFELQDVNLMRLRPEPTAHLRYTDGLMVLSLFEEFTGKRHDRRRLRERGADVEKIHGEPVHIMDRRHIRILRWYQGDMGFTLIGELNRSEMIQIAASLISGTAQ